MTPKSSCRAGSLRDILLLNSYRRVGSLFLFFSINMISCPSPCSVSDENPPIQEVDAINTRSLLPAGTTNTRRHTWTFECLISMQISVGSSAFYNRKCLEDSIRERGIFSFHLLSESFLCWWYARSRPAQKPLEQEVRDRRHKDEFLNRGPNESHKKDKISKYPETVNSHWPMLLTSDFQAISAYIEPKDEHEFLSSKFT